jgi:hypothetical protein
VRASILKAVRLYLEERATLANKVLRGPQIPGTDPMPEPSAPPLEMEEVGGTARVLAVECVVCMEDKVSIGLKGTCLRCTALLILERLLKKPFMVKIFVVACCHCYTNSWSIFMSRQLILSGSSVTYFSPFL